MPTNKKANPEILKHEQKREVLVRLMELKEKLMASGMADDDI